VNADPAAIVVPCVDLDRAVSACQAVGFRLDAIGPADEPTWAELSRPGLRLVVDAAADPSSGPSLRLRADEVARWPDRPGLAIEVQPWSGPEGHPAGADGRGGAGPEVPATVPRFTVGHEADGDWKEGRAGMRYRDLVPGRYGGAYIGSHIHVPEGGPVPDYVHHHDIVHQLIFCHRGWVRVVYQDQGPPFVLEPGDCVLQPPGIRHRVLETSDDLYVVEVGCPAVHRTSVDHDLELPNQALEPARRYGGQGFARHVAAEAAWLPAGEPGLEQQLTGLAEASNGLVSVRRLRGRPLAADLAHDEDFRLVFVTDGSATLTTPDGAPVALREGSCATIPGGAGYHLSGDDDTVVLDVMATDPHRV
jgi:quercetin dioxygenase-like cupin family protein